MAVLVLGGYGLIGQAVVARLLSDGVAVIGSGRRIAAARARWPGAAWREADLARLTTPQAWAPLLADVDVVVNAAGLLQPGLGDDAAGLQQTAMPALYAQAAASGVRRIVQVSAAGVGPDAPTAFMRHKAAADAALLASGVEAVVLRPGLVASPTAYGGTAMLRGLAAMPGITPLVHARSLVQTVAIDDVAEAAAAAVAGRIPAGAVIDLVELQPRTLAETVGLFRGWLGLPPAWQPALPAAAGTAISAVAYALGWLGWRSPLRSTSMQVIRGGVTGNGQAAERALGRPLRTLPQTLAALPSGVQERWFARLWLLKAPVLAVLSVFWLASGIVTLVDPARAVAAGAAYGATPPTAAVLAGAALDIALGLAVLIRPVAGLALKGMILTTLVYVGIGTVTAPGLWLDPLGPLVKVFPALVLALVALATLDDR